MIPYILRVWPHAIHTIYRESLSMVYETIQHIFEEQAPDVIYDAVTGQTYQRWLDIKDKTVQQKQGETTILIDTGIMRNFIDIYDDKIEENHYEGRIGIFYGPPLEYARIHEFGGFIALDVTQKMRNFFVAMFLHEAKETGKDPKKDFKDFEWKPLRKKTFRIPIVIPERSFLRRGLIMSTQDVVDLTISIIMAVLMGAYNPSGGT